MASDTPTPERGELERYRFMRDSMSDCFCDLDVVKNGDLVTFADYEALLVECARKDEEIAAVTERSQYNAWKVGVLTHTLRVASPIHTLMSVDDMATRYNLAPFNPGAPRDGE